ncbi:MULTISPECIES: Hsp20/alpha crystallin family protein [Desulfococcus]|jgi:HSP20 family molecular chaperone IbpA|uniref:Heat shock protein Hsp20 n=1 Tax=Desulfococcus multivorans DSM 2059 TaxID=1121405 RepID=S7V3F3_DESML|nr:Hsp20/alpha crystallin family protein [Desulfococcus multivorans]AOY60262.1 Hsp20/alpha crystallin family protein [Desulfococcus multivorans]AQV02373.1 heat-shock protein Hsp20 [Desulfococcus multivorans]EPR39188.1 heat shock protein Hsp20 [Desulfococcus multivorans DSM 2059]SJZ57218.1 HSP20 family protein [Desulfococcus multivorans DSM 2059]
MSDIQVKQKQQAEATMEPTQSGRIFSPAVDIFETDTAITVIADIPGVHPDDMEIDLRESVLTLSGKIRSPDGEGERSVMREYDTGTYFRQFTLSEVIDQARIDAKLADGVLTVSLPKVAKATPRKIAVTAG